MGVAQPASAAYMRGGGYPLKRLHGRMGIECTGLDHRTGQWKHQERWGLGLGVLYTSVLLLFLGWISGPRGMGLGFGAWHWVESVCWAFLEENG